MELGLRQICLGYIRRLELEFLNSLEAASAVVTIDQGRRMRQLQAGFGYVV
jgi:hypothetical protein